MNLDHFGLDTITFAGPLEAKLKAAREAASADHAQRDRHRRHPRRRGGGGRGGSARAACASPASRCCATSRGSRARSTPTRWTSQRRCCRCATPSAPMFCSHALRFPHSNQDPLSIKKDLQKLALLAGRSISASPTRRCPGAGVNESARAWEIVAEADRANLGLALDSFHILANGTDLELLATSIRSRCSWCSSRLPVAGGALGRGADRDRAPLARLSRRRRAQRKGRRDRAPARRHGLPRRLQLRGVQRRLPAASSADGRRAGAALGEVDAGLVSRRSLPARRGQAPSRRWKSRARQARLDRGTGEGPADHPGLQRHPPAPDAFDRGAAHRHHPHGGAALSPIPCTSAT